MSWSNWLYPNSGADFVTYVGLVLAVIGFWITILQIYKTKNAVKAAKEAVQDLKERLNVLNSVQNLATARSLIQEVKRMTTTLKRPGDEFLLPDRCETLKEILIDYKATASPENQKQILSIIVLLSEIERSSINSRESGETFNPLSFYSSLSTKLDLLSEILAAVKKG